MARKRKSELPEWDDGRTIVSMNAEGMPWYRPDKPEGAPAERLAEPGEKSAAAPENRLNEREARYFTWGALKAALLVVGFICGGLILFILFCQFVWFRQ